MSVANCNRPGTVGRLLPATDNAPLGAGFILATSIGVMINPINSSMIVVALISIGRAFNVGTDSTAWLVSLLYVATAVGQPTVGRLADRLGPRRVYLVGLGLVAMGGLLGFVGWSLDVLIAARVVIGLGTSAAYPGAMAMIHQQSQRLGQVPRSSVLGALAIATQITMAIGPPLGGALIALAGWRSVFVINLPLALVGAVAALRWLPNDESLDRDAKSDMWRLLDPAGLVLFSAALVSLLLFFMKLEPPRWYLFGTFVILLILLVVRELHASEPFIDVGMLARNWPLSHTYIRYGTTMTVTYCFIYGWTEWLEQSHGVSPSVAGLLLMPSFLIAVVASQLASRVQQLRGLLVGGLVTLVTGSASLFFMNASTRWQGLLLISVLFGIQTGVNMIANQAALYTQAPAGQMGAASGLFRTVSYMGAIASITLISLAFGSQSTDGGLHNLALMLTVASAGVLVSTLMDRTLPNIGLLAAGIR